MAQTGLTSLILLALVLLTEANNDAADHSGETRRALSASDKFTRTLQERTFKCKKKNEDCHLGSIFRRCCGDLFCYRDMNLELSTLFDEGHCVECAEQSQICQRDSQCCGNLVCIKLKGTIFDINGRCQPKLGGNKRCDRNKDCQSGDCRRRRIFSRHGACTEPYW